MNVTKQPRTSGRRTVSLYLPDALYQRGKREAVKQGVSLSAYLTRQLSTMPNQLEELQNWLSGRLDHVEAVLATMTNGYKAESIGQRVTEVL